MAAVVCVVPSWNTIPFPAPVIKTLPVYTFPLTPRPPEIITAPVVFENAPLALAKVIILEPFTIIDAPVFAIPAVVCTVESENVIPEDVLAINPFAYIELAPLIFPKELPVVVNCVV